MVRPPKKLFTLLLALSFAACSNSEDKSDAGGALGNSEAGVGQPGAGGGAAGNMDGGGGAAGGNSDGGGAAGGGNRDSGGAAGGGNRDSGGAAGGGNSDGGGAVGGSDGGGGGEGGAPTGPCSASAAPDVGKLRLEPVITGLSSFVNAAQPPGSQDWYLLQQSGELLVRAAGANSNTMLLDLGSEINLSSGLGDDERGLLGIAFAPDFATSGLFYVMMTPTSGNQDQVRQYQKMGSTAMLRETLITLPGSAVNHNGGHIVMRDGLLYVGTGDGGGSCNSDKPGTPQQLTSANTSWFGKILRLDPARKDASYAAEGNPFPESPLVWHYGLRNPYRFGFDRMTGDMYIGDVGQNAYEEVNFAKAGTKGLNFGWAAFESESSTCAAQRDSLRMGSTHTKPVFAADRRQSGCQGRFCDWKSVIGGTVYRGSAVPKLAGAYLTGDYTGARMVAFYQCDSTTSPVTIISKQCDPNMPNAACFQGAQLDSLVAIVEDNAGELYFVANRNSLLKVVVGM